MHIIAAQNVVRWARKRYDMGLGGFGYPAEDSEESWLVMGSRAPHGWSGDAEPAVRSTDDVPPAALADSDSRFVECGGLTVHYKEACIPTVRVTCWRPCARNVVKHGCTQHPRMLFQDKLASQDGSGFGWVSFQVKSASCPHWDRQYCCTCRLWARRRALC